MLLQPLGPVTTNEYEPGVLTVTFCKLEPICGQKKVAPGVVELPERLMVGTAHVNKPPVAEASGVAMS